MDNLLGPFGDGAVATLITSVVAYVIHKRTISKPNIIICHQQSQLELIQSDLLDKLPLFYGEAELKKPTIIRLNLTNIGSSVIENPIINIEIEKSAKILQPRITFDPCRELKNSKIEQISEQEIKLTLDYLNSSIAHNESLKLDLICDGQVENLRISGSGAGWSVQFKALIDSARTAVFYGIAGLSILIFSALYCIISLTDAVLNEPDVLKSINNLWQNNSVQFPIIVFLSSIILTAILALIAEIRSKIPFYKVILLIIPKLIFKQIINIVFKKRLN